MADYMILTKSSFYIKQENFEKALESLKSVFVPENMRYCDCFTGHKHFSWVDTEKVLESADLENALKEIRYMPLYNDIGDICNVEFIGGKYGDEDLFFSGLAPYVESGSYICCVLEEGITLKWHFNNGKVKCIS